ncbi:MAG TPA: GntR family transcriptional regulator [candidate division Zixibacteria bacterium]|nr:GntR family transcriptional regulator [candidate division Zixibacteria bacterium]
MSEQNTTARPAHRRIALELAAQIAEGRYPPGARLPAENELAASFGVSRGTLREALRSLRADGVVESVPGRGNFVKRGSPSRPDARRRLVGVVVPSVAQPYVSDLIGVMEDELHRHGYALLVGSSGSTREQQAGRVHRILEEGASGLIVYPIDYEPDLPLFEHLVAEGFPIVLIDRHLVGLTIDAVLPDNTGGAYAAVSHLAELGHRRIAFVSTDNLSTTSVAERLHGYRQALLDHGLTLDDDLILSDLPLTRRWPRDVETGATGHASKIRRFLERTRPSAVFALHDYLAADVLEAAGQLGLRVPAQLAIVAFDDDPPAARLPVPLTVVRQPRERIGRMAASVLVDRIQGRRTETARIVLPTELVVRASSGARVSEAVETPA